MWKLDHKEGWAPENWCFWIVVLEKTLESPLHYKEIKPVNPKEKDWKDFIGRSDAEAETPILWSPDVKNWLIGKDPDAGKDWMQEEKGMAEDEMVGWHHRLDGSLMYCSPWGPKKSDTTKWLNWYWYWWAKDGFYTFKWLEKIFPQSLIFTDLWKLYEQYLKFRVCS